MLAEAGLDIVIVDSANADEIKQVLYGAIILLLAAAYARLTES